MINEKQQKQISFIENSVKKILVEKPKFFGSIKLNFQNGMLVNSNILETVLYVEDKHKISRNC